jgi:hypothetical protein
MCGFVSIFSCLDASPCSLGHDWQRESVLVILLTSLCNPTQLLVSDQWLVAPIRPTLNPSWGIKFCILECSSNSHAHWLLLLLVVNNKLTFIAIIDLSNWLKPWLRVICSSSGSSIVTSVGDLYLSGKTNILQI